MPGVAEHIAGVDRAIGRRFTPLDLMALPITAIEEVAATNGYVYDLRSKATRIS
jgi:hypothetical protein